MDQDQFQTDIGWDSIIRESINKNRKLLEILARL